ncbi:MAG: TetR/AcrR family transcriptional regulator [Acidiferrobacterales bacterium]
MSIAQKTIQEMGESRPLAARVLDTAVRLFVRKGYFSTSIQDIVQESGVSTGSIYHYFGDKEGIAKALYSAYIDRMSDEMSRIYQQDSTLRVRSRAVVRLLFELTEQEPEAIEFMLGGKLQEFLPNEVPVCSARPFEQMRDMVKEGVEQGEIRDLPLIVAVSALYGAAHRMIHHRIEGRIENLYHYEAEAWECGWRSVAK